MQEMPSLLGALMVRVSRQRSAQNVTALMID